ncbi:MAG: polysaccharide biosynthesis protein [Clostridiales bacterium]|nr:polysaccharide biosynthesis protein [Clostridiales bacterium]
MRQAAILAGASIFVRLLGFFYRIPITHLIGDKGNSFYNSAYLIYAIALNLSSVFMIATLSRLTSERIARGQYRNAHSLFKISFLFSMTLGLAGTLIMFFGAAQIEWLLGSPEGTVVHTIRAISPAVFIVSMLTVFRGYFQGMKTTVPTAISQVVEQVFNVGFSLWLAYIFFGHGLEFAAAGAGAGTAIAALAALTVVAFIYILRGKTIKQRVDEDISGVIEKPSEQISAIVRTAYPMIIGLSVFALANSLDVSMSNNLIMATGEFSEEQVGILVGQYTGKFSLFTTLPVSLSMALSAAVLPEITSAHVVLDEKSVRRKTNLALRLSMMISFPAAIGLAVLADPVISMLFPRHPEGGWLLKFGAISIVFLAVYYIITGVLQGCGYVKLPIVGLFIGVLVKIALNYLLLSVPSINILGAVISTIACFIVAAAVNLFFLKKFIGVLPDFIATFIKPAAASVGMGVVCYFTYSLLRIISGNAVATLGAIALGGIAYIILMALIRGFGEYELKALPIPRKIRGWLGYYE